MNLSGMYGRSSFNKAIKLTVPCLRTLRSWDASPPADLAAIIQAAAKRSKLVSNSRRGRPRRLVGARLGFQSLPFSQTPRWCLRMSVANCLRPAWGIREIRRADR